MEGNIAPAKEGVRVQEPGIASVGDTPLHLAAAGGHTGERLQHVDAHLAAALPAAVCCLCALWLERHHA